MGNSVAGWIAWFEQLLEQWQHNGRLRLTASVSWDLGGLLGMRYESTSHKVNAALAHMYTATRALSRHSF